MSDRPERTIDEALLDPTLRLKKIIGSTEQIRVNPQVPLLRYYRSLLECEKMAKEYINEMKLEKAFILLYRFSWLGVSELKNHPDFPHHDSKEKKQVQALLVDNIELAERIKSELRNVYQIQSDYYRFEEQQKKLRTQNADLWVQKRHEAALRSAKLLNDAEVATQKAGMTMGCVLPLQPKPDELHSLNSPPRKREKIDTSDQPSTSSGPKLEIVDPKVETAGISYGEVMPPQRPPANNSPPMMPGTSASSAFRPIQKSSSATQVQNFQFASEYPSVMTQVAPLPTQLPPPVNRDQKPGPPNMLLDKRIAIASDLVLKFLTACMENTANNVETCGILGGTLLKDKIIVNNVVMPKQTGSANGCTSTDDIELATVLSNENLLSIGWIHTHPTQTAFLSSVDLHTHYGYQQMMSESIAIVCAPSHNEIGTFVLTPEGMTTIGQCDLRGFHPHPESMGELFTTASHVHYTTSLTANIIDLRK